MRPHPHRTPPTITAVEPKKAHGRRSRFLLYVCQTRGVTGVAHASSDPARQPPPGLRCSPCFLPWERRSVWWWHCC
ncbi:hypothetical protein GFS60_03456 [Rhodococcus sp. WAY2]|nr:hypothetical protein GFS60_03456 [Rhodococcus sp. WAY2]